MDEPRIQKDIVSRLRHAQTMRYSEIKDETTDRDLFNYHLRQLVTIGVVEKVAIGVYQLSDKGRRKVADTYHTSDYTNRLFKCNPLLIVLDRRVDGLYILNQKRTAQPSYGIVGVPGGTIKKAEPLLEGARRKLYDETNLEADFEYVAMARRIVYRNDELFSDVLYPICFAGDFTGELSDTKFGENFWVTIDQAVKNDTQRKDRIDAIGMVLKTLKSDSLSSIRGQYFEQITHLNESDI